MDPVNRFLRGDLLNMPVKAAQVTGSFALNLEKVPLKTGTESSNLHNHDESRWVVLKFSWKSWGVFLVICRYLLVGHSQYVVNEYMREILELFGGWSGTMTRAQFTMQGVATFGDLYLTILLVCRRQRLSHFITSLMNVVNHLWLDYSTICEGKGVILEDLTTRYSSIERTFMCVAFLASGTFLFNCIIFLPGVIHVFADWIWGVVNFPIFLLYLELTSHFRLLNFFLVITLLFTFQMSLVILRSHVEHCKEIRRTINLAVATFDQLEKLLEEFHSLFNLQLLIGLVVVLLSILVSSFNALVLIMKAADGPVHWFWYQLVMLFPWTTSLLITFYAICDSSTALTTEANECIWAFQSHPQLELLSEEEKQRILMFVVEKATNPRLTVSPAKLFTLGRHILPTVCPMLSTIFLLTKYIFKKLIIIRFPNILYRCWEF